MKGKKGRKKERLLPLHLTGSCSVFPILITPLLYSAAFTQVRPEECGILLSTGNVNKQISKKKKKKKKKRGKKRREGEREREWVP